jgi:uncharacterized protein
MVAQLLEVGAGARATNNAGATPLHYGAGSERVVALLLKAGANPNARSTAGNTPLHSAAARPESFAQVKLLLEAGAEAYAVREPQGPFEGRETPLSLAALAGDNRTVELLLDHGTSSGLALDAGKSDVLSATALSAAFAGNLEILKLLLSRGGSVNFDGGFAGHALNTAFYAGHQNVARFLLEQPGIDLQLKSSFGEAVPPIVWSAYDETGDPAIARILLSRGVDINQASSEGSTALSWARKRGETALVAFLRSQGAHEDTTQIKRKSVPNNPVPEEASARERMIGKRFFFVQCGNDEHVA